jgi:hypothetical protein
MPQGPQVSYAKVASRGYLGNGLVTRVLSLLPTATTRDGLDDLDLFAGTGVLDKVPDVDDAIGAGL